MRALHPSRERTPRSRQLLRPGAVDGEGGQVPLVDPDQLCLDSQGPVKLGLVGAFSMIVAGLLSLMATW